MTGTTRLFIVSIPFAEVVIKKLRSTGVHLTTENASWYEKIASSSKVAGNLED
jgi:hypothetical protein